MKEFFAVTILLSFIFPPILLMYVREKVLGDKIKCNFHNDIKEFLKEYFLTSGFLNFAVIAITYLLFHHEEGIDQSFMARARFAFHYISLSLILALIEPFIENIIRYHLSIKIDNIKKIHININMVLYIYAFVLFLMNFIRIFDNSFWEDEGYSIRLAKMTVTDMISATASDVHPPLYYMLTQGLYHLLGNNGVAYHLSALLPYAVIMILGCTIIKKSFGIIPATIMITMASLMKSAVIYNVEARMYSLAAMFMLISYVAFYKILKNNTPLSWTIFCLSSLGAAYTHYYSLLSVAFLFAMMLPYAILHKKYLKGMIISYIVAIIGYLPWLMILFKTFTRTADGWWLNEIPSVSTCCLFLWDYKWVFCSFIIFISLYSLYQLNFLNVKLSLEKEFKDKVDISIAVPNDFKLNCELYLVLSGIVSICGTVMIGIALSYAIRPFLITRYLFPLSSMSYLIMGICISKMKFRKIWSIILIIAILWNNVPAYIHRFKDEYNLDKSTTKFLKEVNPSTDVELVTNNYPLDWTLLDYYYPNNVKRYNYNALEQLDTDSDNIWLIWDRELDETEKNNLMKQQYTYSQIYDGRLATWLYFYVYQLHKEE